MPKPPKAKKPPTKLKYRPGLATVLGRAVVLEDFFNGLKTGTDQQRKALAKDIVGVTLDADDLQAMKEMDWDTATTAASSLRGTLPDRQGGAFAPEDKDLAGW